MNRYRWRRWLLAPVFVQLEFLMNASADLAANVAALELSVSSEIAAIAEKLASAQSDDPIVVAANASLVALKEKLDAQTAALAPAPAVVAEPVAADPSAPVAS